MCKPDLKEPDVKKDISSCKYIKVADVEQNPDNYSLLVMKYGGPDLHSLCKNYLKMYLLGKKEEKSDQFWLAAHQLIKGLLFFKNNGLVHNDIKPQNILFDVKNHKLMYIDFGLMRTKEAIIESSKQNDNYLAIIHWSLPFDCGFMEKTYFNQYKTKNESKRRLYETELTELLTKKTPVTNTMKLPIRNPESFNIFFSYISPDGNEPGDASKIAYIKQFFNGFEQMVNTKTYIDVLNNIVDSIDVYGLGFSLQYILNCFHRLNGVSVEFFTRASSLFHKMYDFNPSTREVNIENLLTEYESILLETGILTRLNKHFKNHNVMDNSESPSPINEMTSVKPLSPKIEQFANLDPGHEEINVNCPSDKEFNPFTKRCVKKCKIGYIRNEKFKCQKTRKLNKK
jgi:serine/threonine protein kinase